MHSTPGCSHGADHSLHSLACQVRLPLVLGLQGAAWSAASQRLSGHHICFPGPPSCRSSPQPLPPTCPTQLANQACSFCLTLGRWGSLPVPGRPLAMLSGSQMVGKPPCDSDTSHQLSVLRAPALQDAGLGLSPGDPDDHPRLEKAFLRQAVTVV